MPDEILLSLEQLADLTVPSSHHHVDLTPGRLSSPKVWRLHSIAEVITTSIWAAGPSLPGRRIQQDQSKEVKQSASVFGTSLTAATLS